VSPRRKSGLVGTLALPGYLSALRYAYRRIDRRAIYTWAHESIDIPQGVYTVTGHFDVRTSRYLIKPFDALQSDIVRKVTFQAPTRSGKSLLADIWLMWLIYQSSGPTMWNFNTDPQARKHFRTRLLPLMFATKCIADLLPDDLRKLTQEAIFKDGVPLYVQGPAMDNLQGVGICNLIEDELWRRDEGRHAQALSRLGDYERLGMDKNLNIGQGGFEGDDQDLEFLAGTQEEWEAPCMKCGHVQEPMFSGYRADGSMCGMRFGDKPECRDRHGDWIISKVVPTIRWECAKCGDAHVDEQRTKQHWNDAGDYVIRNWEAKNIAAEGTKPRLEDFVYRSFHINALLNKSWIERVIGFCHAQNQMRVGNLDPLIQFTQKEDARAWSETRWMNAKPAPTFDLTKVAADEVKRAITVDVQEEGLKWLLVASVSKRGEVRPLWAGKVFGEAEIQAKQKEFSVRLNNVFLDAGHDAKGSNGVYAMCLRNGWIALRGDDRKSWLHVFIEQTKEGPKRRTVERSYSAPVKGDPEAGRIGQGKQFAMLIYWSNPTIKNRLARMRDRGLLIFPAPEATPAGPRDLPWVATLKKHLTGQWKRRIRNQITGRFRDVFMDNGEDHLADCILMIVVFAIMAKILVDDTSELSEEAPRTEVVVTA
jgi:hypothetical protein